MDDAGGFARWSYPLLPMLALAMGGSLAIDETGFRFPLVAVGVLGVAAAFATLMLRRSARFALAASEGFLWTIAIASMRAQDAPDGWVTIFGTVSAVAVGTFMAYLHAVTALRRFTRVLLWVVVAAGASVIVELIQTDVNRRVVQLEEVAGFEQVPVARWSKSTATDCSSVEARGQCAFIVDHACVETSARTEPGCGNFDHHCPTTCSVVSMQAWRLPDGRTIASVTAPGWNGKPTTDSPGLVEGGHVSRAVRYAELGQPLPRPNDWLWLAGAGAVLAVVCATASVLRFLRGRRRPAPSVSEGGPYRQSDAEVPDAPRAPASPWWRYARLMALAALLPAAVSMVARAALHR
jgi:hypothetical protein